jgi:hypothetical protein
VGVKKKEVVSFKVDEDLARVLERIPNRSEFIRSALLERLLGLCPFCNGSGVLTPQLKLHWDELLEKHTLKECRECHALVLVCRK